MPAVSVFIQYSPDDLNHRVHDSSVSFLPRHRSEPTPGLKGGHTWSHCVGQMSCQDASPRRTTQVEQSSRKWWSWVDGIFLPNGATYSPLLTRTQWLFFLSTKRRWSRFDRVLPSNRKSSSSFVLWEICSMLRSPVVRYKKYWLKCQFVQFLVLLTCHSPSASPSSTVQSGSNLKESDTDLEAAQKKLTLCVAPL